MKHSKQLMGVFFALLCLVVAAISTSKQASNIQSAMRAFVDEEGNWAKAHRNAFLSLIKFQHTNDIKHFEHFKSHLIFNKGIIKAKKELDSQNFKEAKQTFLKIGSDEYNIDKIIYLSKYFSWLEQSKKAFNIWDKANQMIINLDDLAETYMAEKNQTVKAQLLHTIQKTQQGMLKAEKEFENAFILLAKQTDTLLSLLSAVILSLLGAVVFIFFRKTMNKITENDELYQATFNKSQLAYVQFELNGKLIHANSQFMRLIGSTHESIKSLNLFTILRHHGNKESLITIKKSNKHQSFEFKLNTLNNQESFYKAHTTLIHNYSGTPLYFVAAINDISKDKAQNFALEKLAHRDYLTGLLNKFAFEKTLNSALISKKTGYLLYMDLDNFKTVNDQAGHQVGDRILENVSSRIQKQLRKGNPLARMGGDEFAAFLENITLNQALDIANDIRSSIIHKPFNNQLKQFDIGISIGISGLNYRHQNITELINQADQACYNSKSINEVVIHDSLLQTA